MLLRLQLLAYQPPPDIDPAEAGAAMAAFGSMLICIFVAFAILMIPAIIVMVGMWKLFEKAGKPGWASIVPIYNTYVLTEIAGMDIMWFILTLVPCVNIVAAIMIWVNVAKNFGKDTGYAIGIILLPFVFIPILGFGNARYQPMKH